MKGLLTGPRLRKFVQTIPKEGGMVGNRLVPLIRNILEGLNGVNRQQSNGQKINRQLSKTEYFYRQPSNQRAKINRQISFGNFFKFLFKQFFFNFFKFLFIFLNFFKQFV